MSMTEYSPRRLEVAKIKAEQIRDTGAAICATACHNCVDGLSDLIKKYDLRYDYGNGKPKLVPVPNVCELVANAIVIPHEIQKHEIEVREDVKGKKILVIDDEPDFVLYLQTLLEDSGFQVVTANDGASGIAKALSESPDLITLDITMPGKSGIQIYRDIRANDKMGSIPIFIVTGAVDFRQLMYQKTVQAPEGFLNKPIDKDTFLMTINKILEKKVKNIHVN
jgi:twitching motility two-component system response regulator PilH